MKLILTFYTGASYPLTYPTAERARKAQQFFLKVTTVKSAVLEEL
jgi:hypothetical protein